jgi:hypothetical protein
VAWLNSGQLGRAERAQQVPAEQIGVEVAGPRAERAAIGAAPRRHPFGGVVSEALGRLAHLDNNAAQLLGVHRPPECVGVLAPLERLGLGPTEGPATGHPTGSHRRSSSA